MGDINDPSMIHQWSLVDIKTMSSLVTSITQYWQLDDPYWS